MDFSKLTDKQRRALGSALAIFVGILYGVNVLPLQYLLDRSNGGKDHSQNGLDYVFPHFCGIFFTATVYFLGYSTLKRNKPEIFPHVSAPGLLSGVIWGIAQLCFFVASQNLTMVIAFPLVNTLPGAVAAMWSVFLFKEIRGRKNILILMLSFVLRIVAVILITLSKIL